MCVLVLGLFTELLHLHDIYSVLWIRMMIMSRCEFGRGLLWPISRNCAYIGLNGLRNTTKTHNCPDSKNILPEPLLLLYCHINLLRTLKI
jgi:hypothetical protein